MYVVVSGVQLKVTSNFPSGPQLPIVVDKTVAQLSDPDVGQLAVASVGLVRVGIRPRKKIAAIKKTNKETIFRRSEFMSNLTIPLFENSRNKMVEMVKRVKKIMRVGKLGVQR